MLTLVLLSLLLLQLSLLLMLPMELSMLFIDTVVDAAAGASVDAATTTAGTAVVPSTEMAFATTAVALLKVAVLKMSSYCG